MILRSYSEPSFCADESRDRIVYWPLFIVLLVSAVLVICRASPIGPDFAYVLIGTPLLLLVLILAAVPAAMRIPRLARGGRWRCAASYAVLPSVVLVNIAGPLAYLRACDLVGDLIHFEIMRDTYIASIEHLPDGHTPKLVVFNWGGMIWSSAGVIYDQSDEVTLPPEQQSPAWLERASKTELGCGGYSVTSVGGHFYLAAFPC